MSRRLPAIADIDRLSGEPVRRWGSFDMSNTEIRMGGIAVACLIGIVAPAFLLGPWLFGGVLLQLLPASGVIAAAACAIFGIWLLVVSLLARGADLEKVMEPFQAAEASIFFLPYMLVVGTRSVWRRLISDRRKEQAREISPIKHQGE